MRMQPLRNGRWCYLLLHSSSAWSVLVLLCPTNIFGEAAADRPPRHLEPMMQKLHEKHILNFHSFPFLPPPSPSLLYFVAGYGYLQHVRRGIAIKAVQALYNSWVVVHQDTRTRWRRPKKADGRQKVVVDFPFPLHRRIPSLPKWMSFNGWSPIR